MLGGSFPPFAELHQLKGESEKAEQELRATVEEIQQTGCVVKDLDEGLVDFPCLREGEAVYLCWKLGEQRIEYWHGIDEGFAGRKPLDESGQTGSLPPTKPPVQ